MTLVAIHILLEANQQLKLTLTIQFSLTEFERTRPRSNAPSSLLWICERDVGVQTRDQTRLSVFANAMQAFTVRSNAPRSNAQCTLFTHVHNPVHKPRSNSLHPRSNATYRKLILMEIKHSNMKQKHS